MKKRLLGILISFSALCLNAQTNVDSLWKVWANESLIDTIRLQALNECIWSDELTLTPDSAHKLIQDMLALAILKDNKSYQGIAYFHIGRLRQKESNYYAALENYFRALESLREGNIEGKEYYFRSTHFQLGQSFSSLGQYPQSIKHYSISAQLNEEIGLSSASELHNIGLIYYFQGEYTEALNLFEKSAKQHAENNDVHNEAIATGNIGRAYSELGNYSKAIFYLNKKIEMLDEKSPRYNCGMMTALAALGETYMKMKDYDQALDHLMQSLEFRNKDSFMCSTKILESKIGTVYKEMGEWDLAIEWCTKGHDIAIKTSLLPSQPLACDCLYKAYEGKGNYKKALEYLELMNLLNDSLDREESIKSLQQMEFDRQMLADSLQQEEEKLKVEMAHQQEVTQNEKARNLLLGGGLFLLLAAFGLYSRVRYVRKANIRISKEKDRSENLLLNILPAEIAEELKETGEAVARDYDMVSILFTDFQGFTQASEKLSAADLVAELNACFKAFDGIVEKFGIEKIKTIGDAYMCAGGLPVPDKNAVKNTVLAGLAMQTFMSTRKDKRDAAGLPAFEMRIGIHTGPVVAGIVGVKKFQYDVWGDTVNTASRMESSGEVGQVNISEATYKLLACTEQNRSASGKELFSFESRGKINAKGKGEMEMWFVYKN